MKFAEFIQSHRAEIYAHAERNTPHNANGELAIRRDDPWFDQDEWDDFHKELNERDRNSAARRLVC